MNSWRKFRALTKEEKLVFLEALPLLMLVALMLRLAGFTRCQRIMAVFSAGTTGDWTLERAARAAYLVNVASCRGFYQANCLERSLVLWFLLRRRGVESDLRIGVSNLDHRLKAHAWIERRGVVINDVQDIGRRFAPFDYTIRPLQDIS